MRDYRFRGKRIDNGEWIYGSYVNNQEIPRIIYDDKEGFYCEDEVDPETVGQYTGLKDKNGKEIYEADIIKGTSFLYGYELQDGQQFEYFGQVKWAEEGGLRWMLQDSSGGWELAQTVHRNTTHCCTGEIVGDIHSNPELMEEKV